MGYIRLSRIDLERRAGRFSEMQANLERHARERERERRLVDAGDDIYVQDRSALDWTAYLLTYMTLDWLTPDEVTRLIASAENPGAELNPMYVVWLDPPLTWIQERLATRDDPRDANRVEAYAAGMTEVAHAVFRALLSSCISTQPSHVLRLTSTNRDERVTVISAWVQTLLRAR
jgi:hypothetical protein